MTQQETPATIQNGSRRHEQGMGLARVAVVVGSLVGLAVTPSFAMAYFGAYGYSGGETPPGWLAGTDWPTWISGSSRVSTYKWHGVVFGLALVLVAGGLGRIVAGSKVQGRRQQRAWWLIVGGLGAVAVGSLLEYGISEDVLDAGYGFMLELLGFLSVMVGTITLGLAMRRERAFGRLHSAAIALIGPVGVVVGVAIVGHLPSGPASPLLIAAIAVGATGPPGTSRT